MNAIENTQKFVNKWYLRFLLATELYIVEPWERAVIYALLVLSFVFFWYFNTAIVATGISQLRSAKQYAEVL